MPALCCSEECSCREFSVCVNLTLANPSACVQATVHHRVGKATNTDRTRDKLNTIHQFELHDHACPSRYNDAEYWPWKSAHTILFFIFYLGFSIFWDWGYTQQTNSNATAYISELRIQLLPNNTLTQKWRMAEQQQFQKTHRLITSTWPYLRGAQ